MKLLLLTLFVVAANLTGCAWTYDTRPWDPPPNQSLFNQIPAWDNAAEKTCCSSLSRDDFIKARCATSRPIPPRTNRC